MNLDGMIIAATETERVGGFHEASYRMMQEGRDIIFVTPEDVKKYFGVKPGIDVPIVYKNKMMGAIGITGIPHEVRPAIVIAKMAFETMLEYDDYQHNIIKKSSERELFRDYLLYSETKHTDELRALAQRLKYNINLFRVPILFELSNRIYSDDKLFLLELHNLCHENDMIFTTHEGNILIYKYVQINQDEIILRINHELENFIDTVSNEQGGNGECSQWIRYMISEIVFMRKGKIFPRLRKRCTWIGERYANTLIRLILTARRQSRRWRNNSVPNWIPTRR